MAGCGKKEKQEIEILIPAGSTEAFVYSEVATSSGALDVSDKDLMLLSDSFWESVTKIVFNDFTEEIYETFTTEELEAIKEIFAQISYKEIENPEIEGWYMFEQQTKDNSYHLSVTGQTINFNGKDCLYIYRYLRMMK